MSSTLEPSLPSTPRPHSLSDADVKLTESLQIKPCNQNHWSNGITGTSRFEQNAIAPHSTDSRKLASVPFSENNLQ